MSARAVAAGGREARGCSFLGRGNGTSCGALVLSCLVEMSSDHRRRERGMLAKSASCQAGRVVPPLGDPVCDIFHHFLRRLRTSIFVPQPQRFVKCPRTNLENIFGPPLSHVRRRLRSLFNSSFYKFRTYEWP